MTTGKPLKSEIIGAEAGLDKPKNISTEMTEDDWCGVRLPTLTGEDPFFVFNNKCRNLLKSKYTFQLLFLGYYI